MTNKLKDTAPFTENDLRNLVANLKSFKTQMWNRCQLDNRTDYAIQYSEVIRTFLDGIYTVWESYGYGWADDLTDDNGIDGGRLLLFQIGIEDRIKGLLHSLQIQNIFGMFEGGDVTRNTLIIVYEDLLKNLKLGKITF